MKQIALWAINNYKEYLSSLDLDENERKIILELSSPVSRGRANEAEICLVNIRNYIRSILEELYSGNLNLDENYEKEAIKCFEKFKDLCPEELYLTDADTAMWT